MIDTSQLIQGTPEWEAARVGSAGASRIPEVVAKTKTGPSASRAKYMGELIVERLTGVPYPRGFVTASMLHGTETEPAGRAAYEFMSDSVVETVGLIRHPMLSGTHASPDGLIGKDGLLEIKCPDSQTHIATLLGAKIDERYITQMLWQMRCTGRQWCDFVSFDPRMPPSMQLFIQRVHADPARIREIEAEVTNFLIELDEKVALLREKYDVKAAA